MNNEIQKLDSNNTFDLAKCFIQSGYFKDMKQISQAVVKIEAGKSLGLSAFTAMQDLFIVQGKIQMSANLMGAMIKRSGKYSYAILRHDDKVCEIEYYEQGKPIGKSVFTVNDAQRAGVGSGTNYNKYPRNMLFARAMSNGAKWYCGDVFLGSVYSEGEIDGYDPLPMPPKQVIEESLRVDIDTGEVATDTLMDDPMGKFNSSEIIEEYPNAATQINYDNPYSDIQNDYEAALNSSIEQEEVIKQKPTDLKEFIESLLTIDNAATLTKMVSDYCHKYNLSVAQNKWLHVEQNKRLHTLETKAAAPY